MRNNRRLSRGFLALLNIRSGVCAHISQFIVKPPTEEEEDEEDLLDMQDSILYSDLISFYQLSFLLLKRLYECDNILESMSL